MQKRIDKFAFPNSINRTKFDLNHVAKWKASEFRTFFLYMSLTVMKDILKAEHYWNLACLVYGEI